VERIGFFNPIASGGEQGLNLDDARVEHWVSRGAQMSERVAQLVKQNRKQEAAAA
jgi:small subunit ribosomal protein S16